MAQCVREERQVELVLEHLMLPSCDAIIATVRLFLLVHSLRSVPRCLLPARLPACLCAHELHQYWMHFNLSHIPVTLKVQCIGGGVMSCWMDFIQMIRLVYAEPNCTDNDDDNDTGTQTHTIHSYEKRVSRARIQFESF